MTNQQLLRDLTQQAATYDWQTPYAGRREGGEHDRIYIP